MAGRYTEGSTLRHIVATSVMGAAGLMTLFVVDLADLYFLSLLGEIELAAAVGYAGSILFFTTSACIGVAIAMAALISRAVGAGEDERAKRLVAHGAISVFAITVPLAAAIWFAIPQLLDLAGAAGRAHELAEVYLRILVPSMPILALAMASGGVLRARGAARLAMYSTIAGGIANAVLDPIFIFGLDLGVAGAAIASVIARFTVLGVAMRGVMREHPIFEGARFDRFGHDAARMLGVALPAVATNLATPVGNLVVMRKLAEFGDDAVAGYSIIGRLTPVAFGVVFALSGAIGPIVGQNFGAEKMDRVRRALLEAAGFAACVVLLASAIMFLCSEMVIDAFGASPEAADLIRFFVLWVAPLFVFAGFLFVANAAFNNLGRPLYSTGFNWGRATLGTLPFVALGASWGGAPGVLLGHALGGVVFGALAFFVALRTSGRAPGGKVETPAWRRLFATPLSAQTNIFGWIASATGRNK